MKKYLLFTLVPFLLQKRSEAQTFINGDFQNGFAPWTNNGAQYANIGINGDPATNYYFDVTPNMSSGNGASIEQKISFKTSCNYTISFQLRPGGPAVNSKTAGIRVEMDGQIIAPGKFLSANWKAWATVTTSSFFVTAGQHTFKFVGDNGGSETPEVMGLDNIRLQKMETCGEETGCCPGKNLICNGDFEEGQKCFESQYAQGKEALQKPGTYIITNYNRATELCKNWGFNKNCQRSGNALFVNGVTNGQGNKIIWQEKINFNAWKQYRFCADVYLFNQCCFNVVPKLIVMLTYSSGGQTKTVLIDQLQPDACGWIKYTKYIAQWEGNDGGNATVSVTLDETGIGDGNDFAIDNISLKELQPLPKSITNSVSITAGANGTINGSFTGDLSLYSNSGYVWYIVPLDNNGQPDANCPQVNNLQWAAVTNFNGFDGCKTNGTAPGKLSPGRSYKIVLGTFGFCYAWDAAVFTVKVDPATQKINIKRDDITGENDPVFKMVKPNNKWIYDKIMSDALKK